MKIGYRDRRNPQPHALEVDGVRLYFGSDGVLWNPTTQQVAAMTSTALRCARFIRITPPAAQAPRPEPAPPVAAQPFAEPFAEPLGEPLGDPVRKGSEEPSS